MKIVILIDEINISAWIQAILDHIISTPGYEITRVVVRDPLLPQRRKTLWTYKLFRYIDRKLFLKEPDAFRRSEINLERAIPVVYARPVRSGYKNAFADDILLEMTSSHPDLILRFGFGIISGKVLTIAKYGVWSLHHGDNSKFRGGPPGFWEWYHRAPVTGVTLQRLTDELDGGKVIGKFLTETNFTSLVRNQSKVFWAGTDLVVRSLGLLATNSTSWPAEPVQFYDEVLWRNPNFIQSLHAFRKLIVRAFTRALEKRLYRDQWTIFFCTTSDDRPALSMRSYRKILPPKDRFWADPFVVSKDGMHFIFFEEFIYKKRKGHISCMMIDGNGKVAGNPQEVLSESYHLSYPFIFQHGEKLYMIPESSEAKQINVFECVAFPLKWKHFKTIMKDVEGFDTTLHFQDGLWWLFQTERRHAGLSPHDSLYLYFTNDLFDGVWKSHPGNPVVNDPRSARSAGRIFQLDGQWYRPSQIATPRYGYGMCINKIIILNQSTYKEEKVSEILPRWTPQLLSTHTINTGFQITTVDGQVRRSRI